MSQWNLCRGGCAESRSDARNNLAGNPGRAQRFNFLPRASENQRVARLQTNDLPASFRKSDHQEIDLFLTNTFAAGTLPHTMKLGRRRNETQNLGRDQIVVKHNLGALQQAQSLHCKQLRITRPRTHQVDFPFHAPSPFPTSSGSSDKAASTASLLASECSRSSFCCLSSGLAKISLRVSPSSATHAAYPGPNCFSSCCLIFCASDGLCPAVETAICKSPRRTTLG